MQNVKLVWITPDAEKVMGHCARVSNPANQDNPDVAGLIAQAPDEATNPETGKKDRIRSHLSALKDVLKMDDTMDRRRQQAEAERQALEAERRRQIEALGHAAPRELDPFSPEDWPDYCRGLAATGRAPAQTLIDHHQQLRAAQPMAEDL